MIEREQTINAIVKRLCYDRPSGKKLYTYDNANGVHNTKMTWILGLPLTRSGNLHLHNNLALARKKSVSLEDTKDKNAPEDADVVTTRKETAVRSIDDDLRLKLKLGQQVFTLRSRFRQSFSQSWLYRLAPYRLRSRTACTPATAVGAGPCQQLQPLLPPTVFVKPAQHQ